MSAHVHSNNSCACTRTWCARNKRRQRITEGTVGLFVERERSLAAGTIVPALQQHHTTPQVSRGTAQGDMCVAPPTAELVL